MRGGLLNDLNRHNQRLGFLQEVVQKRKEMKSMRDKLRDREYRLRKFIILSSRNSVKKTERMEGRN